jgi:hypothetical protein
VPWRVARPREGCARAREDASPCVAAKRPIREGSVGDNAVCSHATRWRVARVSSSVEGAGKGEARGGWRHSKGEIR